MPHVSAKATARRCLLLFLPLAALVLMPSAQTAVPAGIQNAWAASETEPLDPGAGNPGTEDPDAPEGPGGGDEDGNDGSGESGNGDGDPNDPGDGPTEAEIAEGQQAAAALSDELGGIETLSAESDGTTVTVAEVSNGSPVTLTVEAELMAPGLPAAPGSAAAAMPMADPFTLGEGGVTLAAGASAPLEVSLDEAAVARLRGGRGTLQTTVTSEGGTPVVATAHVKLKL